MDEGPLPFRVPCLLGVGLMGTNKLQEVLDTPLNCFFSDLPITCLFPSYSIWE